MGLFQFQSADFPKWCGPHQQSTLMGNVISLTMCEVCNTLHRRKTVHCQNQQDGFSHHQNLKAVRQLGFDDSNHVFFFSSCVLCCAPIGMHRLQHSLNLEQSIFYFTKSQNSERDQETIETHQHCFLQNMLLPTCVWSVFFHGF